MPLTGEYEPSPSKWAADQAELIESSNGTEGTTLNGMPVVLLTIPRGEIRETSQDPADARRARWKVCDRGVLGGAPKNPVWYYNVKADPHVELRDGHMTRDMVAREVTGEEKAVWWERAVAAFPNYADYQKNTDREIPVFVLEPA